MLSVRKYCNDVIKKRICAFWGTCTESVAAILQHQILRSWQIRIFSNKINTEWLLSAVKFQAASLIPLAWKGNLNEWNSKPSTYSATQSLACCSYHSLPDHQSFYAEYILWFKQTCHQQAGEMQVICLHPHVLCLPREDCTAQDALISQIRCDPANYLAQNRVPVISSYPWNVQSESRFSGLMVHNPCAWGLRWAAVT